MSPMHACNRAIFSLMVNQMKRITISEASGFCTGARRAGAPQPERVAGPVMTARNDAGKVPPMTATAPAARPGRGRARQYLLNGQSAIAPPLAPGLHLVATPIGNLRDITVRALEALAAADLIACEDTRVTRKLLDHYGIATPLTPYHDHNAAQARPKLLARLGEGAAIALVSDAGTPLISDPGYKLVREARTAGLSVMALPGASAVLTALTVAALPTVRFFFEGFLPAKEGQRRSR